jgi:hypothetical protein
MRNLSVLALALVLMAGCPPRQFHGNDRQMMHAAKIVAAAIDNYHADTAEWPDSLEQAKGYLPPDTAWPTNPYNGQPLADTFSPKFDPAKSVGMVYYQKMLRDGQLVSYQLHVFGERDKLYIIGNTAVGPKE